jgi:hypothetical protein
MNIDLSPHTDCLYFSADDKSVTTVLQVEDGKVRLDGLLPLTYGNSKSHSKKVALLFQRIIHNTENLYRVLNSKR